MERVGARELGRPDSIDGGTRHSPEALPGCGPRLIDFGLCHGPRDPIRTHDSAHGSRSVMAYQVCELAGSFAASSKRAQVSSAIIKNADLRREAFSYGDVPARQPYDLVDAAEEIRSLPSALAASDQKDGGKLKPPLVARRFQGALRHHDTGAIANDGQRNVVGRDTPGVEERGRCEDEGARGHVQRVSRPSSGDDAMRVA